MCTNGEAERSRTAKCVHMAKQLLHRAPYVRKRRGGGTHTPPYVHIWRSRSPRRSPRSRSPVAVAAKQEPAVAAKQEPAVAAKQEPVAAAVEQEPAVVADCGRVTVAAR